MEKPPSLLFVSLRLTFDEKARLQQDAAGMPVSEYMRWRLFDPNNPPPRRRGKNPVKDHKALAQALGLLGQSRLSSNLNQLARSANTGSLPVTADTEAALLTALDEIHEIRRLLIEALNLGAEP
ncbi:MAG: hypothetical protein OSB00_13045 [Sphingomonas bacterium]|nr:hypothetical protein [Sphingomonas bacterium]